MSFQFTNLKTQNSTQDSDINSLKSKVPSDSNFGKTLISNNNQNIWEWGDYKKIEVTVSGTNFYFNNNKFGNDGTITLNLDKNQKYLFDCTNLTQNSLTLRFSDVPDGYHNASGATLSSNYGINYYTNFITAEIDFNNINLIYPFCTQSSGYCGSGDNSSHISFNESARYINSNRNIKINDSLLVDNVSGTINLNLPDVGKNYDKIKIIPLSSGTINLVSTNFLINNNSTNVNIISNKEVYFYNNSWLLTG